MSKQSADLIWVSFLESAVGKFPKAEPGFDEELKSVIRRAMEGQYTDEMLWKRINQFSLASNDPAFGIVAGLATSISQEGSLVRMAVIAAPSPKDLYWLYQSTFCRQNHPSIRINTSLHRNTVRISMSFDTETERPAVEAATAGMLRRLTFKGRNQGHIKLHIDPSRFDVWERFDRYPNTNFVHGSAGSYAIDFTFTGEAVSGNDDWQVLKAEIERLMPPEDSNGLIPHQIAKFLMAQSQPASVTLDQVAETLDTPVRTLRRKISNEGVKFKDIQLKVVWDRARSMLMDTDQPIEAISETLGFKDRTSFTQSFKRAAGITPMDFRTSHKRIKSDLYKSFIDYFESIPPRPNIVRKLMNARRDINVNVEQVASIIESDPLKQAKVIAAASTAIYGVKVKSLSDAVSRVLGIDRSINIALFHSFKETLGEQNLLVNPEKVSVVADISWPLYKHLQKEYSWSDSLDQRAIAMILNFTPLGIYVTTNKMITSSMVNTDSPLEYDALSFNSILQSQVQMNAFSIAGLVLASWGVLESEFVLSEGSKEYFNDPSHIDHRMAPALLTSMLAETAVIRPKYLDGLIEQISDWGLKLDKNVKSSISELIRCRRV